MEILATRTSRLRTTRQAAYAASGTARGLASAQESLAHAFPTSARHGLGRWQLDPSARVVTGLERCRLAWDVVQIAPERQQARRAAGPVAVDPLWSGARARLSPRSSHPRTGRQFRSRLPRPAHCDPSLITPRLEPST